MTTQEQTYSFATYLRTEIGLQLGVSDRITVEWERNPELKGHVVAAMISGLSKEMDVISYPTDWWHGFKARWFPAWAKERWPVEYRTHTFVRFCPHKGVPELQPHLDYLELPYPSKQEF